MPTRRLVQRDPQAVPATSVASPQSNVHVSSLVDGLKHVTNYTMTADTGTLNLVVEALISLNFVHFVHFGYEDMLPRRGAQGDSDTLQIGSQLKRLASKEFEGTLIAKFHATDLRCGRGGSEVR